MTELNPQIPLSAMGADPNAPQQQMSNALQMFQLKDQMQQRNQAQQQMAQEKRTHKKLSAMTDRAAGLFMKYQSLKEQGFSEQSAHAAMQEDFKRELGGLASERFDDGSPLFDQRELQQFGQEFNAGELGMVLPKLMGAKNALDMYFKTRESREAGARDERDKRRLALDERRQAEIERRNRLAEAGATPTTPVATEQPQTVENEDGTTTVIPPGKRTPIPSEIQARLALGESYAKQVPDLLAAIDQGKSGTVGTMFNVGTSGLLAKRQESGVDALVRNLTGAGKSKEEAESYASRYQFEATDSDARKKEKVLQLVSELKVIDEAVKTGRGWPASEAYSGIESPRQLSTEKPGASRVPMAGEVRAGYRYKGGNPASPSSWEKQ